MTQCSSPTDVCVIHGCGHPDVHSSRCAGFPTQSRPTCAGRTRGVLRSRSLPSSHSVKPKAIVPRLLGVRNVVLLGLHIILALGSRQRRVHLSKEMSVIHVKWPVGEPSHLLAETLKWKTCSEHWGPTGSAPSQEMG